MTKKNLKERISLTALNIFFIGLCFVTLIPILYALSVSLSGQNSLLSSDFSFIPKDFTLDNYKEVIFGEDILTWFKNTVFLASVTVFLSLLIAVPAAYCFSRRRFPGRKAILKCLVLLNSFPAILSMFAIYRLLRPMGLVNHRIGLILVYTGTMAVFSLWNTKGYFDTIPTEIEEAAKIDGASDIQVVLRIVLPLAKPSIITTALQVLIYVWNEYIYATTFMTGESKYTLAAGLNALQATEMTGSWPVFAAASITVSVPVLIIFFLCQKYMVWRFYPGRGLSDDDESVGTKAAARCCDLRQQLYRSRMCRCYPR